MSDDAAYHRLFSQPQLVAELLRDVIRPPWLDQVDLSTLTRVNVKLHGEGLKGQGTRRREADVIWKLRGLEGGPIYVYLALEFQSRVDKWMALRIGLYVLSLYAHLVQEGALVGGLLPPVYPVVLYNGEGPWTAATRLRELIAVPQGGWLDDFQAGLGYHVVDEQRYPAEALRALRSVMGLILELEQCREAGRGRALVGELAALLQGEELGEVRRAVGAFLNEAKGTQHLGMDSMDFKAILEGGGPMLKENFKLWTQQWLEQGIEQGIERGIEQGRAEGREGQLQTILKVLAARFGGVPASVSAPLSAIRDAEILGDLAVAAATAPSLGAFQDALRARGSH